MAHAMRPAALAIGLAVGAYSLALARSEPGYSFGGGSAYAGAAELIAGYALLTVGLIASTRRRETRLGAILVAASTAWFLVEWNNPGAGSAFVFSVGLVLSVAAAPLVAHAALGYPEGSLRPFPDRLGLGLAYAGSMIALGVLPAAVFDPQAQGCAQCPRNLLLVAADDGVYQGVNRIGVRLGPVWSVLLILLILVRLVRSTPARRRVAAPVALPGGAFLGLVAADFVHSWGRGFLTNDSLDRQLWLGEASALAALAVGVAWAWVRARRTRSALARLVIDIAESPPPGGLRDALAVTLDDPSLQLLYPLSDGRLVDARGSAVEPTGETTPLLQAGREVALLSHRPGLLDDPVLVEEVVAAGRLALENERLQAETRAQLADLRASRSRIVETSDAERRRLEQDLHDGAQQRLVGLSLALRLARSRLGSDADPALLGRLDGAEGELRAALADLRELAHGIFPAVLAEEGLAAAVEALAEDARTAVEITALPEERFDPAVEAAAYYLVSEVLRNCNGQTLVNAVRRDGRLVVEVGTDGAPEQQLDLQDRIGAVDGMVQVVHEPSGRVTIRAEIPCVS